jgi:hypothetical protein
MGAKKTLEERITALEEFSEKTRSLMFISKFTLRERIRELEAKVVELESTDATRRLNMTTEDPEWY